MAALDLAKYVKQMEADRATRATDKARGLGALQSALASFGPDYGKGAEMEAKAAAGASAISSGLGGTSMPGSVSAGLTAKFEDMRLQGQAGIQQAIAGFLSGFRDPTTITPQALTGISQTVPPPPPPQPTYRMSRPSSLGQSRHMSGSPYAIGSSISPIGTSIKPIGTSIKPVFGSSSRNNPYA